MHLLTKKQTDLIEKYNAKLAKATDMNQEAEERFNELAVEFNVELSAPEEWKANAS